MDESDGGERSDIIELLRDLCVPKGPCVVKVFVASRPIAALNRNLAKLHNSKTIRLQDVNSRDIFRFAVSFLGKLGLPPDIIHPARDYIVQHARGVFIWVHLVGEELRGYAEDGCTKNEIFEFLESLPTELEGFYERILKQLEGGKTKDIKVGQRMLQFVQFAFRPLRLEELRQALAIRDSLDAVFCCSDKQFEEDLIHGIERRIISCAGNFLEIKGVHGSHFSRSILLELFG
jgi:hypothetical protein